MWLSIGDKGPLEVNGDVAVQVEVESPVGWTVVATVSFVGPFASGAWTAAQQVELEVPTGPITALRVAVDPADIESECHEDDNVAETRDALCP